MDYEKKYREALERAKEMIKAMTNIGGVAKVDDIQYLFPELKESEDERMIQYFKDLAPFDKADELYEKYGFSHKDAIAWLEKQSENSMGISETTKQKLEGNLNKALEKETPESWNKFLEGEQKSADKVEPKFKVGDWIINTITKEVEQVIELTGCEYICSGHLIVSFNNQHLLKRWAIQDAKDGDVLYLQKDGKEHIIIYKGVIKERFRTFVSAYCAYNGIVDAFCFADVSRYIDIAYGGIMPATKEQRDQLEKAMADAGYTFDFEKKELKTIEQNSTDEIGSYDHGKVLESLMSAKTKTPEESLGIDSETYSEIIDECIYGEQNPAWSEEDKELMMRSIENLTELRDRFGEEYGKVGDCINWLKSLRPQNHWKPSEDQLKALYDSIPENVTEISQREMLLNELYKGLKYKL